MKIAIVSDIHVPHWVRFKEAFLAKVVEPMKASIEHEKPDVIIDAGDLEDSTFYPTYFPDNDVHVLAGNHDYYGRWWTDQPTAGVPVFTNWERGIIGATLWTDMNRGDGLAMIWAPQFINDFSHIHGLTVPDVVRFCESDVKFLSEHFSPGFVKVIVTHHLPSFKSIHPKYLNPKRGELELLSNFCFASHLDELVEKSGAKLWIHGHTHDPCDYYIGETRVVCNPCGYPFERRSPYEPVYVEV